METHFIENMSMMYGLFRRGDLEEIRSGIQETLSTRLQQDEVDLKSLTKSIPETAVEKDILKYSNLLANKENNSKSFPNESYMVD